MIRYWLVQWKRTHRIKAVYSLIKVFHFCCKTRVCKGPVHSVTWELSGRRKSICDRPELQIQFQRVVASNKFERSKRMQKHFVLVSGIRNTGYVLLVGNPLLLFHRNIHADIDGTEHIFTQEVQCPMGLNWRGKELSCVFEVEHCERKRSQCCCTVTE